MHSQIISRAVLTVVTATGLLTAAQAQDTRYTTAIFVENRAGKDLNDKVQPLEDFVTSRITEKGFTVISRETAVSALNNYATADKPASTTGGGKVDEIFANSTTALRLAQSLGADYVIAVSLASFGSEKKTFTDNNLATVNDIYTVRVTYKICDAQQGGSFVADTIKVSKTLRTTANSSTDSSDVLNELMDDAAQKIAENIAQKKAKAEGQAPAAVTPPAPQAPQAIPAPPTAPRGTFLPPPKRAGEQVEISISCGMQDLASIPMSIPDIRTNADGTIFIGKDKLEVQVLDAVIEMNGAVVGSAPGSFKVPHGFSHLRITREGFKDWERTINATAGLRLRVPLQMSEAGYQRWKDNLVFLDTLENGKKLTDAQVKVLEGYAQMLRQSGYKVDVKADIKGDALAKPQFSIYNIKD